MKLALIFGGASPEHSVSCVSALGIYNAINKSKYDVIEIGITKSGKFVHQAIDPNWKLSDYPQVSEGAPEILMPQGRGELRLLSGESIGRVDVAFPVLHGVNGEDGTIQGLLQLCGIPFVGNGVLSSALAIDKSVAKRIFQSAGLSIAHDLVIREADYRSSSDAYFASARALMTPNCFVKPARSGSSVGVTKVNSDGQLGAAIEEAFKHGDTVLVESELLGREIECSVLEKSDGTICVSKAGEIRVHGREFYDYEAKYIDNSAELIVPAELSEQELSTLQELASTAFRALGCTGLARADFFLTAQGFVISEINTMPGFTPISMYPALWAASGLDYPELVESLIETGLTARR